MNIVDWDSIKVRLSVLDTRVMRPDTIGEKVDDAINVIANDLMRELYAVPESGSLDRHSIALDDVLIQWIV